MNGNYVIDLSWEDDGMYAEEEDEEERYLRESGYLDEPSIAPSPSKPQANVASVSASASEPIAKKAGLKRALEDNREEEEKERDVTSTASLGEVSEAAAEKIKPSGELSEEQKGILRSVMEVCLAARRHDRSLLVVFDLLKVNHDAAASSASSIHTPHSLPHSPTYPVFTGQERVLQWACRLR